MDLQIASSHLTTAQHYMMGFSNCGSEKLAFKRLKDSFQGNELFPSLFS
jgi:hypothetical protein